MMFCFNALNNVRLALNTVCHLDPSNCMFLGCHQYFFHYTFYTVVGKNGTFLRVYVCVCLIICFCNCELTG